MPECKRYGNMKIYAHSWIGIELRHRLLWPCCRTTWRRLHSSWTGKGSRPCICCVSDWFWVEWLVVGRVWNEFDRISHQIPNQVAAESRAGRQYVPGNTFVHCLCCFFSMFKLVSFTICHASGPFRYTTCRLTTRTLGCTGSIAMKWPKRVVILAWGAKKPRHPLRQTVSWPCLDVFWMRCCNMLQYVSLMKKVTMHIKMKPVSLLYQVACHLRNGDVEVEIHSPQELIFHVPEGVSVQSHNLQWMLECLGVNIIIFIFQKHLLSFLGSYSVKAWPLGRWQRAQTWLASTSEGWSAFVVNSTFWFEGSLHETLCIWFWEFNFICANLRSVQVFRHRNFERTIALILVHGANLVLINCSAGYHRASAVASLLHGVLRDPCFELACLRFPKVFVRSLLNQCCLSVAVLETLLNRCHCCCCSSFQLIPRPMMSRWWQSFHLCLGAGPETPWLAIKMCALYCFNVVLFFFVLFFIVGVFFQLFQLFSNWLIFYEWLVKPRQHAWAAIAGRREYGGDLWGFNALCHEAAADFETMYGYSLCLNKKHPKTCCDQRSWLCNINMCMGTTPKNTYVMKLWFCLGLLMWVRELQLQLQLLVLVVLRQWGMWGKNLEMMEVELWWMWLWMLLLTLIQSCSLALTSSPGFIVEFEFEFEFEFVFFHLNLNLNLVARFILGMSCSMTVGSLASRECFFCRFLGRNSCTWRASIQVYTFVYRFLV